MALLLLDPAAPALLTGGAAAGAATRGSGESCGKGIGCTPRFALSETASVVEGGARFVSTRSPANAVGLLAVAA